MTLAGSTLRRRARLRPRHDRTRWTQTTVVLQRAKPEVHSAMDHIHVRNEGTRTPNTASPLLRNGGSSNSPIHGVVWRPQGNEARQAHYQTWTPLP